MKRISATAHFDARRLLSCVAATLAFRTGCANIKGVYLHRDPNKEESYVKPPNNIGEKQGVLWLLKNIRGDSQK